MLPDRENADHENADMMGSNAVVNSRLARIIILCFLSLMHGVFAMDDTKHWSLQVYDQTSARPMAPDTRIDSSPREPAAAQTRSFQLPAREGCQILDGRLLGQTCPCCSGRSHPIWTAVTLVLHAWETRTRINFTVLAGYQDHFGMSELHIGHHEVDDDRPVSATISEKRARHRLISSVSQQVGSVRE